MAHPQNDRLAALERRFSQLEPEIPEGPVRQALSLLHALIHESRRAAAPAPPAGADPAGSLEAVRGLHKTAPPMQGAAQSPGLPSGTLAPDFTLPDAAGAPITLSALRGRTVVLAFYPLDWSPACSDQLSLYQSERASFAELGADLLAISVDSLYSHGAWAAVRGLEFPLLADFNPRGEVARRYRVWRESDGFSERALFVVDAQGAIRYAHVSPELHKIPSIYELLDVLRSLRPAGAGG